LHWHGGQLPVDGSQPGQPQAQPPPEPEPEPPPPLALGDWHTPDWQGWPTWQGMPNANHMHLSVVSPEHEAWSVNFEQGSLEELPPDVVVPVDGSVPGAGTAPPEPQPHAQGGQFWPAGQVGQLQVQVPPLTQPEPPPPPPGPQSHWAGGQGWPGAQAGPAQVQVPPPPEPPLQSHSGGGQGWFGAQATGVTHAQPFGSAGWQKPPPGQVAPMGHNLDTSDQAQRASFRHDA
jgi:hypothetical protein